MFGGQHVRELELDAFGSGKRAVRYEEGTVVDGPTNSEPEMACAHSTMCETYVGRNATLKYHVRDPPRALRS